MTHKDVRPLRLLVSYSMDAPTVDAAYADSLHELAASAARALVACAPDVQVVTVDAVSESRSPAELVASVDGVLVLGGADLDPSTYDGGPAAVAVSSGTDLRADEFELDLIRAARSQERPLFAICRGMQLVNVAFGGTLIPHVEPDAVHRDPVDDEMVDHEVVLEPGCRLGAILGTDRLPIRSSHHQAADRIGDGLAVTARADDGLTEAVEATDGPWLVAVQWHPEDPGARADDFARLCAAFVAEARAARAGRLSGGR